MDSNSEFKFWMPTLDSIVESTFGMHFGSHFGAVHRSGSKDLAEEQRGLRRSHYRSLDATRRSNNRIFDEQQIREVDKLVQNLTFFEQNQNIYLISFRLYFIYIKEFLHCYKGFVIFIIYTNFNALRNTNTKGVLDVNFLRSTHAK